MDNTRHTYTENQTVPNQLEYPILGAAGAGARQRDKLSFYRSGQSSLEELINTTSVAGNIGTEFADKDTNSLVTSPDQKNEILGIPSFLSYPSDLGKNRRHHHFVLFNIYQGTSDQVRLETRKTNQLSSSLLAKGGWQFANQTFGGNIRTAKRLKNNLISAGYSDAQAEEYLKALQGRDGISSFTSDERIGAFDNYVQGGPSQEELNVRGNLQALGIEDKYNGMADAISTGAEFFRYLRLTTLDAPRAATAIAANAAMGAGKVAAEATLNIADFAASYVRASNRDNLAESNKNPKNFNQRGASGRYVNRPKQEQNVLLANRRFNNANIKSKDTICLYMPQKFSINDQLIYSEEEMGTSKMVLDALTGKRGAASALLEKVGRRGVSDVISAIGSKAGSIPGVGAAVNEVANELNLGAVRAAAERTVQNPRREMMFRDVGIRSHSFSFDFAPRNEKEAETVLNIIRMLRYHAYPGLQGGGGHFFTFPAEFELTFYTIDDSNGMVVVNDNLPKLPRLALQSVSVDYSAAGDFKTFTDAKPAFIRLELGFQEMEQLTNEHIVHGY